MYLRIRKGTPGRVIRFLIRRPGDPGESATVSGLTFDSDVSACFVREGDREVRQISLADPDSETFTPGGFREVDREHLPGLYELHLPAEALTGAGHGTVVMVRAPGAEPVVIHLDLVAYDPYDGERLGLEALSREGRHQVITRAFREVVPAIIAEYHEQTGGSSEEGS